MWPARLTWGGLWTLGAGLALMGVSGPLNRYALVDFRLALLAFVAGILVSAIGTLLTIVGVVVARWRQAHIPRVFAGAGIVVGLLVVGSMVLWIGRAMSAPPIHEISTDLADPPAFVAVTPLRRQAGAVNPPEYAGQVKGPGGTIDVRRLQREHYPDIQPLQLAARPDEALGHARRVAEDLGWKIVAYVPAQGRLEATDSTAFFGFKDDVVVRVRPSGAGTLLDVRSKSRVGLGDAGTNAKRVRAFLRLMGKR